MKKCLYLLFLSFFHTIVYAQELPNIVFILADDLGWSDLDIYGSDFYDTPNIDQLASEGIRFTNAYAAAPICSPTRASILTGKYPVSVDITNYLPPPEYVPKNHEKLIGPDFNNHLPLKEKTIPEYLSERGYGCISIGKWHLGSEGYLPTDQGFNVNIAGNYRGAPPSYYYPYKRNESWQLGDLAKRAKEGTYLTDQLSIEAAEYINNNKNNPFFIYLSFYAVHIPLQPKDSLFKIYQNKANIDPGKYQSNPYYAAMVRSVDNAVGRVLNALEKNNLTQNTIIFFTSDNGGLSVKKGDPHTPATNNFPLKAGKGYIYEGGIRIPLIVRWPGKVQSGIISDHLITSTDILPTILESVGINRSNLSIDGKSFLPVLFGDSINRGPIFWHFPHYTNQGGKPGGVVRLGNYKLIEFYEDGALELYDLNNDIKEENNLIEELPEKAKELHQLLINWLIQNNAKMPYTNPNFVDK